MHTLKDNPEVDRLTLTDAEAWQLSDYMKSIYRLKEAAETLGNGNSHISGTAGNVCQDKAMAKRINEVLLPQLFKAVEELLTPQI